MRERREQVPSQPAASPARRQSGPPAPPSALLALQRTIGNRATVRLLQSSRVVRRLPVKTREDPQSEFAMGTAAALEQIVAETATRLGVVGASLSLGGGAGVWALRPGRAVQDLDFRLSCPDSTPKEQRDALLKAVAAILVGGAIEGSTAKGTWGGLAVSITLAPQPIDRLNMGVVAQPQSAGVPLAVVAPMRLLMDKILAFVARKEKPGERLEEKLVRDAHDILVLVEKLGMPTPDLARQLADARQSPYAPEKFNDQALPTTFNQKVLQLVSEAKTASSPVVAYAEQIEVNATDLANLAELAKQLLWATKPEKKGKPSPEELERLRQEKAAAKANKTASTTTTSGTVTK